MKPITLLALLLMVSPALLANSNPPSPPPQQNNDNSKRAVWGLLLGGAIGFAIGYSWDAKPKEQVQFGIQVKPGEK